MDARKPWTSWLGGLAVAVTVGALCFCKAQDPDLGFHFATGRAVLALGKVPGTNVLSYTHPDHPWLLHQWAPAVLFELVRRRFAVEGVTVVKAVVVVATWLVSFVTVRRLFSRSVALGATLVVAGATAASFRFVERPLIFSNLAMALVLLAIAAVLQEPDARRRRRHLAGAVAVTVVASHLHAGAVNAYLFLLVAAVGVALEALRARAGAAGRAVALELVGATLVALAISAATLSLYNPHGVRVLTVPFLMANDAYQAQHLVEFRPPTRFPVDLLGSYWLLVAITVGLVIARIRQVHLAWLLLFAMTLVLSLRHVRLAYDFALVAVVVSAATLASTTGEAPPRLSAAVLVVACVAGPMHHWSRVPRGLGWAEGTRPTALFDVLRRENLTGRAFLTDGWAALYLGEFSPGQRVFFDMRLEAYPPTFAEEVYQHTRYGLPRWREHLDAFGVEVVLLKYSTSKERGFQGGAPNLRQQLAVDPAFRLVAFDDQGELFVRSAGVHGAAAARLGIAGVDPDRLAFTGPPRDAWTTLEAALSRPPRSKRLLVLSALAAADAGAKGTAGALADELAKMDPAHPQLPAVRGAIARP